MNAFTAHYRCGVSRWTILKNGRTQTRSIPQQFLKPMEHHGSMRTSYSSN